MIIDQWDDFRRKHGEDGDPDNTKISPKERKAQELFNVTIKDIDINDEFVNKGTIIDEWARELSKRLNLIFRHIQSALFLKIY